MARFKTIATKARMDPEIRSGVKPHRSESN
jgi:hypothetical protein